LIVHLVVLPERAGKAAPRRGQDTNRRGVLASEGPAPAGKTVSLDSGRVGKGLVWARVGENVAGIRHLCRGALS
jgi:hypothetical protein